MQFIMDANMRFFLSVLHNLDYSPSSNLSVFHIERFHGPHSNHPDGVLPNMVPRVQEEVGVHPTMGNL